MFLIIVEILIFNNAVLADPISVLVAIYSLLFSERYWLESTFLYIATKIICYQNNNIILGSIIIFAI